MNSLFVARLVSVVLVGACVVGCGDRSDHTVTPVACTPTLAPASAPATAAAVATLAAPVKAAPTADAASPVKVDKPAPKPEKAKVADAPLKVKRLVLAEGVERGKREPIREGTSFKASEIGKLYAFIEVENPEKAESELLVSFEPQSDTSSPGQVSLKVGASPRWRTWAFTRTAKKPGKWAAIVRSADGVVLARTPFEVTL